MLTKNYSVLGYEQFNRSPASTVDAFLFVAIPEDNSLSNLDALRGVCGAHPRVGVRQAFLARHSLSMRKLCVESYELE